jgi:CRP-like cAMP-binding protein
MPSDGASGLIGRELFLASLISDARRLGAVMHRFALHTEDLALDAGEALYRAGEVSDHFFFLVSGQVKLSRPGAADSTFGERAVLGTLDAIVAKPHTHTAIATKPTRLLRIQVSDWADVLEDNFEIATHVVTQLANRVLDLRIRPPPLGGFDDPPPASTRATSGLQVVDRILRLRAVPTFARASTQALAALAQLGSTTFAGKDEVMFAEGETKGSVVIIASGEVSLPWEGSPDPARFGESSLLAGSASLGDIPLAEVRALTPARAIVVPREDYFDVMEEHFDLVQSTLAALSEERQVLLDRGS